MPIGSTAAARTRNDVPVRTPMVRASVSSAGMAPALARAIPARSSGRLNARQFTLLTMLACLLLQRFAIPVADLPMSLATPVCYVLVFWGLISGALSVDRQRLGLMLGLCAVAGMAFAFQVDMPLAIAPRASMFSLIYWLALTGFAILTFQHRLSETEFFRVINLCLLIVAVAGILQYSGQFVGLSVFSFSGFVPDSLLIESLYAVAVPMANGTLRSNGFFLVEPSTYSQYMAVAIIVEGLYFRRPVWLLTFFAGLLVSISGTGWLVLGAFVVQAGLVNGRRGILVAIGVILAAAGAGFLAHLVAPEVVDSLLGRQAEFDMQGTSGNERFVTPYLVLQAVLEDAPRTFFTGIGPGAAELVLVPFKYVLNTPVKILLEYGIFGLLFYIALLVKAERTRRQSAMLLPLLVMLLFAGGYQVFSPVLFSVLLMMTVAKLQDDEVLPLLRERVPC
jgi:hypothetical protein